MIGDINRITNAAHFDVEIKDIEQAEGEMIQGIMICSDANIKVVKGNKKNEIIVNIIDKGFTHDLRKEPNIIAINTNSAIMASKEALSATSMRITISPKE